MAKTTALVKRREPGELLIHEESSIVCRESGLITNNLGGAVTAEDILGLPVKIVGGNWELAAAVDVDGSGTTVAGVILDGPKQLTGLANGATSDFEYSILARGPAAVNDARLPAEDAVGAAITAANLIADLLALNIVTREALPEKSEQTT